MRLVMGMVVLSALVGLPGALLTGRRGVRYDPALVVAAGLGWNLLACQLLDALGRRAGSGGLVLSQVLLGGLIVSIAVRGRSADRHRSLPSPIVTADRLMVAGAIAFALVLWAASLLSWVPPFQDGMNHGFMTQQIRVLETVDTSRVASLSADGTVPGAAYYPLGLHTSVAAAVRLTGAPVDGMLTLATVVAAAVVLPLSLARLARVLAPTARLAGGSTAVLGVLFLWFPVRTFTWGGLALIAANALAPAVAAGWVRTVGGAEDRPAWAGLGVATVGVFVTHNSAVAVVALLAACGLPLALRAALGQRAWRRALMGTGLAAAGAIAAAAPSVNQLLAGAEERIGIRVSPLAADWPEAIRAVVTAGLDLPTGQPGLMILCAVGAVGLLVWNRWASALIAAWCGVAAVVVATAVRPTGWWSMLAVPWYRQVGRLSYTLALLAALIGGIGIAGAVDALGRQVPARRWQGAVALGVVLALLAGSALADARRLIRDSQTDGVAIDGGMRRVFARVAQLNPPGATVIGEVCDTSTWMWALEHVPPLIGVSPASPAGSAPYARRLRLLSHLDAGELDGQDRAMLGALGARYVVVGRRSICPEGRFLDPDRMETNPLVVLRYRTPTAALYELRDPGR